MISDHLRRARIDEGPALTALAMRSKAHWGYSAEVMAGWRGELTVTAEALAQHATFVCDDSAQLLGFVQLIVDDGAWRLEYLYVDPVHLGRGIGRQLLCRACTHATEHGATALSIDADPNAEAFYVSRGATRAHVLLAPIPSEPSRSRPQLLLLLPRPDGG